MIDRQIGEEAGTLRIRKYDEPQLTRKRGPGNKALHEPSLVPDVRVRPLEIHELRGEKDDDARTLHPFDVLELLAGKSYQRCRNREVCASAAGLIRVLSLIHILPARVGTFQKAGTAYAPRCDRPMFLRVLRDEDHLPPRWRRPGNCS